MVRAVNLTLPLIAKMVARAIQIDDPELNIVMLELSLYDIPPEGIPTEIEKQKERILPRMMNKGQKFDCPRKKTCGLKGRTAPCSDAGCALRDCPYFWTKYSEEDDRW